MEGKNAEFMLTSKDLSYLEDIFSWNENAYKIHKNNLNNIKNQDLKRVYNKAIDLFYDALDCVLEIFDDKGVSNEK